MVYPICTHHVLEKRPVLRDPRRTLRFPCLKGEQEAKRRARAISPGGGAFPKIRKSSLGRSYMHPFAYTAGSARTARGAQSTSGAPNSRSVPSTARGKRSAREKMRNAAPDRKAQIFKTEPEPSGSKWKLNVSPNYQTKQNMKEGKREREGEREKNRGEERERLEIFERANRQ